MDEPIPLENLAELIFKSLLGNLTAMVVDCLHTARFTNTFLSNSDTVIKKARIELA